MLAVVLVALVVSHVVRAIGQQSCVSFASPASDSTFTVVSKGEAAPVFTSPDDWPGVHRAVGDFISDIKKVTGTSPKVSNATISSIMASTPPIIIGTLGKSSLVSQIVNNSKIDVSAISGRWETFQSFLITNPLPGVSSAYLIIGSDKRGTIYGLYDHSEQFGVSPWYWYV